MGKNSSWADGTERLLPTSRYARFVWNGKTLDLPDPLTAIGYEDTPIVGANTTASGKREVLHERDEEVCVITTEPMVPEIFDRVRRMLKDWAGHGEQVEVYVDRSLRAFWGFEDGDVHDNNRGNPFRANAALVFSDLIRGGGITMPTAGALQASLISQLPGGSANLFFSAAEGSVVLTFKPSFAGNDAAEHVLFDCVIPSAQGSNRLLVKKRADNLLHIIYYGANSAATVLEQAVSWAADTEHVLMVQWKALTDLQATLDTTSITTKKYYYTYGATRQYGASTKYGQVIGSTPAGNEQIMNAPPTSITLGTDSTQTMGRYTGVLGALAIYTVAYGLPELLKTFAHSMRTYYPRGEFIDASFRPLRANAAGELYYYTLRIRDGK